MNHERATFEELIAVFNRVVEKAVRLESTPHDFGTGMSLGRAEIHTVAAILERPGINMTQLAAKMSVTKSAASQMVSKLSRKGLVEKTRPLDNEREVRLLLTDLGRLAGENHEDVHRGMQAAAVEYLGNNAAEKMANWLVCLRDIDCFMDSYEDRLARIRGQ